MTDRSVFIPNVEIDRYDSGDLVVDGNTDFAALARRLASATEEVWPSTDPRWDPEAGPLIRVYRELGRTGYADRLAAAVAGCLGDRDPNVRYVILCFFREFPGAAGSRLLLDVLSDVQRRRQFMEDCPPSDGSEAGDETYRMFRARAEVLQNSWKEADLGALVARIRTSLGESG